MQACAKGGGQEGHVPPQIFRLWHMPAISTRGADYTHHSTTSPPGISDLATGLNSVFAINQYNYSIEVFKKHLKSFNTMLLLIINWPFQGRVMAKVE